MVLSDHHGTLLHIPLTGEISAASPARYVALSPGPAARGHNVP